MAEPIRSRESRDITVEQLWEDYLAHCRAKNLSPRTIEWYEFKLGKFADWCGERGIFKASQLDTVDLEDYLAVEKARGIRPNSLRGTAQTLKTLCRFGFRRRFMADIITGQFEMPKAPQVLIETFTDDQLHALLDAPDARTWNGIRDRAIMLMLFDTMARVSEVTGLLDQEVDLSERSIRVMGKGGKGRELPLGNEATAAAVRYRRLVEDLRPSDAFFISQLGAEMHRRTVYDIVVNYGKKAGLTGVRCSPHTLRHTAAKKFILNGGDVFTLQKLLGHTTLYMVRRYVELSGEDIRIQHKRFSPGDSVFGRPRPVRDQRKRRPRTIAPGVPITKGR